MKLYITHLKAPWPEGAVVGDVVDLPDVHQIPVWAVGKCLPVGEVNKQPSPKPISALMSGAVGWGRAVNGLETDALSASPSRARAPFANHEAYDVLPTNVFDTLSASKQDEQRIERAEFLAEKAELTPERVRYWLAMDCWTLDQAHCLLIGFDWNVIQLLAKNAGWDSPISVPDFSDNFRQFLCAARDGDVLKFPATPADVIRWAACKKLNLPELLLDYAATLDKAAPVIAAPLVTPEPHAAPVVEVPDPERRLAALHALGGTVKYRNGEWKFTGMALLVKNEQGRKRNTEKTIRLDLREAAQAEREATQAGAFINGLGQRR